jgi:hypothetical protein
MGEIIAFQSPAATKRAQARDVGEQAQILFFTGVRYVRAASGVHRESDAPDHPAVSLRAEEAAVEPANRAGY